MASFLLWEYLNKRIGRFHSARTVEKKDEMVTAGMFDATDAKGTDLPMPTGSAKITFSATVAQRTVTFKIDPVTPGMIDYGNGTAPVAVTTATKAYTYPTVGTFTAKFTPDDTNIKAKSISVTTTPVVYTIAAVVTDLTVAFTVTPKGAGKLDFGDSSTPVDLTTSVNTASYTYAAAGTFATKFIPTATVDTQATKSVTVTAPA